MGFKSTLFGIGLLSYLKATNASPVGADPASIAAHGNETFWVNAEATYSIVDTYDTSNFFNSFTFFTDTDPTSGWVNYQSQSAAQSQGLINTNNNQVYMGVDHTTLNPAAPGRNSVRVTSNKAYTHGLFIADIAHMPGSICGVWPAFWLVGGNWPNNGEIDVLEGVNLAGTDQITLHTGPGCTINTAGSQSGTTLLQSNCNANSGHDGCGATTTTANAYGTSFNSNGGGVYAMQWESSGIYVWFFARGSIPADISSGNPVTANWGTPVVSFNGGSGCDIDSSFQSENIVFDTTFCGDWAGSVFDSGSCSQYGSCDTYVGANPSAFQQAYWEINSVKVYQIS